MSDRTWNGSAASVAALLDELQKISQLGQPPLMPNPVPDPTKSMPAPATPATPSKLPGMVQGGTKTGLLPNVPGGRPAG